MPDEDLIQYMVDIFAAQLSHNMIGTGDVTGIVKSACQVLGELPHPVKLVPGATRPAVAIRRSAKNDCLMPVDYPMVVPSFVATRRTLAVQIGLGRKRKSVQMDANAKLSIPTGIRRLN